MELCSPYSSGVIINMSGWLHPVCDRALGEIGIPTYKIKTVEVHADWVQPSLPTNIDTIPTQKFWIYFNVRERFKPPGNILISQHLYSF